MAERLISTRGLEVISNRPAGNAEGPAIPHEPFADRLLVTAQPIPKPTATTFDLCSVVAADRRSHARTGFIGGTGV